MPSTVRPGVKFLSGSVRNVPAEATEPDRSSSKVPTSFRHATAGCGPRDYQPFSRRAQLQLFGGAPVTAPQESGSHAWRRPTQFCPLLPRAETLPLLSCSVATSTRCRPRSVDRTSLRLVSPKSGNISDIRRRLSAISPCKWPNLESGD